MAADSETVFDVASASEMLPTANSLTSVTSMVKLWLEVEPSVEVAVTSMVWDVAVSASKAPATVTMPVLASMAKKPPGFDDRLYVTVSVTSASVAKAVMPTAVPMAAFPRLYCPPHRHRRRRRWRSR